MLVKQLAKVGRYQDLGTFKFFALLGSTTESDILKVAQVDWMCSIRIYIHAEPKSGLNLPRELFSTGHPSIGLPNCTSIS
jgi:hypothetical protein